MGAEKIACGFPAPIGAGETVGGKKGCFWKIFIAPISSLIVTRPVQRMRNQIKNKKIGNAGINWKQ
jgi:hypothetical protein